MPSSLPIASAYGAYPPYDPYAAYYGYGYGYDPYAAYGVQHYDMSNGMAQPLATSEIERCVFLIPVQLVQRDSGWVHLYLSDR